MYNNRTLRIIKIFATSLTLAGTLAACGGGGGGGGSDFIGAAITTIQTSPQKIDTGDRTLVTSGVSELHPNGIALKFRFPSGLTYVPGSALLRVKGAEIDISPAVNASSNEKTFLVFYLTQESVGEDGSGNVSFELEGRKAVPEGKIEVDADVDDPEIPNSVEFDIQKPELVAEEQVSIRVVDQ